ncbi:aminotransferase class I/II-fold pyridoxal phosphate-dependent enzyme [Gemella haemolysans]|uniref:Aminotransferase class I/II-fold pyridoxal phosphate-dependent enzyme n=1 Tax=Gemella haemolysans TaxID=1379 RepID=A0AAW6B5C7_9BACL|nr:aminotransferase class I/II-fold pyridoxal phosphate-dependent enzyme [Gemella haemolysans]MDB6186034.1 aminotransferase class I/II-fold pyridoxal phosphate-dependent enzyme [Gemella haemolysans]MDU4714268.1 aminotransferase class I/II-fold pyridoxal phosphate-dependent enzyme [Gemella haemolysans]
MSFFSKLGENIILPQDVLIQSKETAAIPGAINATIGIATSNKKAMALPSINKVITEINNSEYLPYSPTPGLPKMRELWKEKILADNPSINKDFLSLPMVTTGITQGIDIAANLFSESGDALLLPNLFWQNYAQIYTIKLGNKIYKYNQFDENNEFSISNFKETLYSINEDKISLILNFPNNPTGYTPSDVELNSLVDVISTYAKENKNKQLIIVSDDAYFGLFFENNHKTPTLSATYKLAENENCLIVKLDGITKEFYSWGLRVGFITYYTKNNELRKILLEKTQGYLRSTTSSPSNLSQQIAVRLLDNKQSLEEKEINDKIIEERYNELKQAISTEQLDQLVRVLPFNSGYFFTIKLPSNINAHEFRLKFLNEYKYGVYSMDDEHIRIAFSCLDKELIPELINKFKQCIKQF